MEGDRFKHNQSFMIGSDAVAYQDSAHLGEFGLETGEIKNSKNLCDICLSRLLRKVVNHAGMALRRYSYMSQVNGCRDYYQSGQ
jgi:hypothetical protein